MRDATSSMAVSSLLPWLRVWTLRAKARTLLGGSLVPQLPLGRRAAGTSFKALRNHTQAHQTSKILIQNIASTLLQIVRAMSLDYGWSQSNEQNAASSCEGGAMEHPVDRYVRLTVYAYVVQSKMKWLAKTHASVS